MIKDEALNLCEEEGLLNMVDNAQGNNYLQLLRTLLLECGDPEEVQGAPGPAHGRLFHSEDG